MATDTDILEAMKQVEDPELGVNVVDLGLVYGVGQEDEGRKVRLDMTLTTVACPLTDMIEGATNAALIGLDDIQEVEINWVWSPPGARTGSPRTARWPCGPWASRSDAIERDVERRWRYLHWLNRRPSCRGTRSPATPAT